MPTVNDMRRSKRTPRGFVIATDSFMGGWGEARGGRSLFAIAVDTEAEGYTVIENFEHRPDFKRVRWSRTIPRLGLHDHITIHDRASAPRYFVPGAFAPERDRRRSRKSKSSQRTRRTWRRSR